MTSDDLKMNDLFGTNCLILQYLGISLSSLIRLVLLDKQIMQWNVIWLSLFSGFFSHFCVWAAIFTV